MSYPIAGTPSQVRADALPYRWNAKLKRFQWAAGAAKGQLASRAAILSLTDRYVSQQGELLQALGDRLMDGDISLREFQQQAGELVRNIHTGGAIIGRGGPDQLTNQNWQLVIELIKRQLFKGKDPLTGRRFGLKFLAGELQRGEVSRGELRRRLGLYAKAGRLTADEMRLIGEAEAGRAYGVRELGATDQHCPQCVEYASRPPMPLPKVVRIGEACSCGPNCRCSILAMTLAEAIAGGMQRSPQAA